MLFNPLKNTILNRVLINKILPYSAKKNKTKPPALYSVLKPDTNSDSPSIISKGVRPVSDKLDVNQINASGGESIINQVDILNSAKL